MKTRFYILLAALLLASAPVFAGGIVDRVFNRGAKSLARQALNLNNKAAELLEKAAGIEERALALSDRDRRAYQAELERLGFVPPAGLFNNGQALLTGAPPAPEGPGGILGFIGGLFGGRNASPTSTLNGVWSSGAIVITISGSSGVITQLNPTSSVWKDGASKRYVKVGDQFLRNLTKTDDLTWTGQQLYMTNNNDSPNVATGTQWLDRTITMNADGQSFITSSGSTYTRGGTTAPSTTAPASTPASTPAPATTTAPASGWTWTRVSDREVWQYTYNTSTLTADINAIAYGNGKFVAVGDEGKMAYSADGISWTAVADSTFDGNTISAIAWGNNRFVAGGGRGRIAYSADGVSWTAAGEGKLGTYTDAFRNRSSASIYAIAFGNNRWVAVGSYDKIAYSADGVSWTAVADSTFSGSSLYGIMDIAFGNNRFVAVGDGTSSTMAYSADGARWTAVTDSTFGTSIISAIGYGNNRWVAGAGTSRRMAYSANGQSWTAVADGPIPNGTRAIAWGNNRYVAGGYNGRLAYSADGASWTQVTNSSFGTNRVLDVAYGNGRFVAVGENGRIAYADW
ncbi:MAG: hypothetical protein LBQ89_00705 [Treponema sp.]|jgi:hypothetical protein|nr:hypothetical protein [Treponema sp.]